METSLDASRLLSRPSVFEEVAATQLETLVSPSLRFILAHYTARYPRQLLPILNKFDDLYAVVGTMVEGMYLGLWNAGMIEKFYGIKRVDSQMVDVNGSRCRLSKYQIGVSLLEKVWGPYIALKLDTWQTKLAPKLLLDQLKWENSTSDKIKIIFLKLWSMIKLTFKLINIAIKILYISDHVHCTNIFQFISRISLSRLNQWDHQNVESHQSKFLQSILPKANASTPESANLANLSSTLTTVVTPIYKLAWSTTDTLLPMGIFLLKFAEWYQTNKPADDGNNAVIKVPAPSNSPVLPSTVDSSKCSICSKEIHNPCMIETGYVFCYKCIFEYLRDAPMEKGGVCPISNRRLFGCEWNELKGEWDVRSLRGVII